MSIIKVFRDENGKFHRPHELGPAIIKSDGDQEYYEHGELHRPAELGPAIIGLNSYQYYYENGKFHRPVELGPAIINSYGDQFYYEHGKCHRPHELGPAIIYSTSECYYFEHGINRTLKEFKSIYKLHKWFRWQKFYNKHHELFEKVLGLPANHDSVLGKLYPEGGDLYKETYKGLQNLLETF